MAFQNLPDSEKVQQLFPEKKELPLEGLYLGQGLVDLSQRIGRSLVITNFLTDRHGVVAKTDRQHKSQVPVEIKNPSDWRLFQELMAQADVIISGAAYFKRVSDSSGQAQNILSQFEPGGGFEELGQWRLGAGYPKRSPDLAVVARSLDFRIPDPILKSNRRKVIFTTHAIASSAEARAFSASGIAVVGCGETGVDGNCMVDWLSRELGSRVVMMSTGPRVLALLLEAQRLDLFYVTEVQRGIPLESPANGQTLLPGGKKVSELDEFRLAHQFQQDNIVAEDGTPITQFFFRYDRI